MVVYNNVYRQQIVSPFLGFHDENFQLQFFMIF